MLRSEARRHRSIVPALACLIPPPTDYSGVTYILYVGLAVATVVALFVTVWATRSMKRRWLKLLLRALPVTVLWSFAPLGHAGDWWPAPFGVLFGSLQEKLYALESILLTSTLLFATCVLLGLVGRRDGG